MQGVYNCIPEQTMFMRNIMLQLRCVVTICGTRNAISHEKVLHVYTSIL
jgi:hypothetical protein